MAPHARDFLTSVFSFWGIPYIYGGKGRHGIDCSGLVTWAYRDAGGPDWTQTHGTARLWDELEPVPADEVSSGHLAFFTHAKVADPEKPVDHVEVVLPYGLTIGSRGGDSKCTTVTEAARRGAGVKLGEWTPVSYRLLVGFRALPLDYST